MSQVEKMPVKIIFLIDDFQEKDNKYDLLQFVSLKKEPIKIDDKIIETTLYLDKEVYLEGSVKEKIKLISKKEAYPPKEFSMNIFSGIDNVFNLNVNEEGDCSLEITKMWYIDFADKPSLEERRIADIKYNGKYIQNYEKLYERKRINILNAKLDYFEKDLFSKETLDYLKKNKNKSYKFDILMNKENYSYFLSEIVCSDKVNLFNQNEKEKMKNTIDSLNSEMKQILKELEEIKYDDETDKKKLIFFNFLKKNFPVYEDLEGNFEIYNKRWNLDEFTKEDFDLFMSFSELQLYFKDYKLASKIPSKISKVIGPKFNNLKAQVNENQSLSIIDKVRIICGFSKFCCRILQNFDFPELFFVDQLKEDEPFKMALNKFKDIIDNLKESSGLFKILLLFYMGSTKIINDWDFKYYKVFNYRYMNHQYFSNELKFTDFKNEFLKIKLNENDELTFPALSMLTIEQIKKHSLSLLPKYFFKIPFSYDCNATSSSAYRIAYFNETRILNKKINFFDDIIINPNSYVLPWMIVISHEIYSHLKTHFSDLAVESPILNPIKGFRKLMCPNYYSYESGYYLEYFLADDFFELQFLKTRNITLNPLTDSKYWTDINFNQMKDFIRDAVKDQMLNYPISTNSNKGLYNSLRSDMRTIGEDNVTPCAYELFNRKRRKNNK